MRIAIAWVCPLERPDVVGAVWTVPVEAVEYTLFGDMSSAAVGDIDGDGVGDVAVGIPRPYDVSSRVHLFSGADGRALRTWAEDVSVTRRFGRRVVGIGDVDGGGLRDVAVSAEDAVWVLSSERGGRVLAFPDVEGHVSGLRDVGDLDGDGMVDLGLCFARPIPRVELRSGADGARLLEVTAIAPARFPMPDELERDWVVCGLGDVDGDGVADVAVGCAPDAPADAPTSSRHAGLVAALSGRSGAELWVVPGERDFESWPSDLAALADRDGDGVRDLAIGSCGVLELRSGRTGMLLERLEGPPRTDWGESVRAAGDVDGDGREDLFVVCTNPDVRSEQPFPTDGWVELLSGTDLELLHREPLRCDMEGEHVAPVGDLDGDGRAEWFVCIPQSNLGGVDFPCCDSFREPHSWVSRVALGMEPEN